MGVLQQGTPTYAGYEFRPQNGWTPESLAAQFPGEPGKLVENVFRWAKKGRLWHSTNPTELAEQLGVERRRIVRALEIMEERGQIELRASDVRQVFSRLRPAEDADALTADLMNRFDARERAELGRLEQVVTLIETSGCQVNALVSHFGEKRRKKCGHCGFCESGKPAKLPPAPARAPIPETWKSEIQALRRAHPNALGEPRQVARFLCGLSSPATTREKLSRHPRFGALEERPFAEVLAWAVTMDA